MPQKPTYEELKRRVKELEEEAVERKQAKEALREAHELLEKTFASLGEGIFVVDQTRAILACNPAGERIFGYTKGEMVGRNGEFLHVNRSMYEDFGRKLFPALDREGVYCTEFQMRRKDGSIFFSDHSVAEIVDNSGHRTGMVSVVRDINERKLAEQTLRTSEEFSSSLLENSPIPILVANEDTSIRYVNPKLEELTGYTSPEIIGKKAPYPWWFENPRSGNLSDRQKSIHNRVSGLERLHRKKNGDDLWIELTVTPIIRNGEYKYTLSNWVDITERKRAEKALRESEEKYRSLFNEAMEMIHIVDENGRIIDANPTELEVMGYTREEYFGKSVLEIIHPDYLAKAKTALDRVFNGEELGVYETVLITKHGEKIDVEVGAFPQIEDGKIVAERAIIRDIRKRKRAEEEKVNLQNQLEQAQKMEAIGRLAGGIAHDFNNLLMGIQGRASLLLIDMDSSHPHFEHLTGIEEYIRGAADLTRQLLGFARSGKYEVKPTYLNEIVKRTSTMFGRTKKEITIHRKYQKNAWAVEADQGQIEQVLVNLYLNAWQSMPGGGELILQTENIVLDEKDARPLTLEPGNYVKLSVADTGMGMDEATRERIFEPFFTTKEMGRGSGLGLASVYGIIKNHNGFIDVYSEKDEGTTFNIYLPASEKQVIEEKELLGKVLKGTETVLLVDDEDMIINVGKQMTEKLGYELQIARSGKEGIEIYKKSQDKIDMVILDMVMPDMGGNEVYDRMKEINPDIKVLLSSGYSINGHAQEILDRGCNGFIQKPFNLKQLSQKLREILDKKQSLAAFETKAA